VGQYCRVGGYVAWLGAQVTNRPLKVRYKVGSVQKDKSTENTSGA